MNSIIDIFVILQSLGLTVLFVGLIGFERQRILAVIGTGVGFLETVSVISSTTFRTLFKGDAEEEDNE